MQAGGHQISFRGIQCSNQAQSGSCRLKWAVSFVRTEPRRARESLVGPLAPALDHPEWADGCAMGQGRRRIPLADRGSQDGTDREAHQGLTGATRQSRRHAAAITNGPTEVTVSNDGSDTGNGQIPLIFIHGAWLSARSWENYVDYFGKCGFAVSALSGPASKAKSGNCGTHRGGVGRPRGAGNRRPLRAADPRARSAAGADRAFVRRAVRGAAARPRSGRAGVAMSPAPPKGILALPFSTLKSAAPALAHPSKWHGVVTLTPEEFTYGFVNTFSEKDAAAAYERYAVPETGQIFYEGGFANFHLHPPTEVHFRNEDRAPLLLLSA